MHFSILLKKTLEHRTNTIALKVRRYDDINIAFHEFYTQSLNSFVNFPYESNNRTILTFDADFITYVTEVVNNRAF